MEYTVANVHSTHVGKKLNYNISEYLHEIKEQKYEQRFETKWERR